jgi:predicted nucleic acid-binding protein
MVVADPELHHSWIMEDDAPVDGTADAGRGRTRPSRGTATWGLRKRSTAVAVAVVALALLLGSVVLLGLLQTSLSASTESAARRKAHDVIAQVEDQDIADAGVLSAILARLGQPTTDVLERAEAPENKERLRAQTERATEIGLFGAPSFVVGGEIFWGNDRLEHALTWARRG